MKNRDITRLDMVKGASVLRQGHFDTLAFTPRNSEGEVVDLTGKIINVKVIGQKGIVYETAGNFNAVDSTLYFSISENIGHGEMWMEITVTDPADSTYRQKFPTNEYEGKLFFIRSADDLDYVGFSGKTVAQFEAAQAEFTNKMQQDFDVAVAAVTQDSEVALARMGETSLRAFNQKTTEKLAETSDQLQGTQNFDMSKGMIGIIDDDGFDAFMNWVTLANTKGIKLSLAVNTAKIGSPGYLTLQQLKQLKLEGHDILSHLHNHDDLNTASLSTIETSMTDSLTYLKNNDIGDDLAVVYTKGLMTVSDLDKVKKIKAIARKHFKYGINAEGGVNYLPLDSYEVKRRSIDLGTQSFSVIKPFIDEAFNNKQLLIILTHSGLGWNATTAAEMVDYIQGLGMPIKTFREAEELIGNAISHGDTRTPNYHFVSRTGASINSSDGRKPTHDPLPIKDMDTPISAYEYDKKTRLFLYPAEDKVTGTGGVMEVYRGATNMSYALFFPGRSQKVYRRAWSDIEPMWMDWVDLTERISSVEVVTVTRDVSLTGLQSIPISNTGRAIKSIEVIGAINGTKKTCQSYWAATKSSGTYQDGTSGNTHTTNLPIVFSQDGAGNRTSGALQVPFGGLNINWSVLSGTGATGTAQLTLRINYA